MLLLSKKGSSIPQLLMGITISGLTLAAVSKALVINKNAMFRTSARISQETDRSLLRLKLKNTVKNTLTDSVYMSRAAADSLGLAWYTGTVASPTSSIWYLQNRYVSVVANKIVPVADLTASAFDIVVLIKKDPLPSLSLKADSLIQSNDGATNTVAVTGDASGYVANDIIALSTTAGIETVQFVSATATTNGYNLTFKNLNNGSSLWSSFLPQGTMIYKVSAVVIGVEAVTKKLVTVRFANVNGSLVAVVTRYDSVPMLAKAKLEDPNTLTVPSPSEKTLTPAASAFMYRFEYLETYSSHTLKGDVSLKHLVALSVTL